MSDEECEEKDLVGNPMFNVRDELQGRSVEYIRSINESAALPYAVAVFNVEGNLNIGMIIRSACVMGAERVIVFGNRQYDRRSCVGAHNYIDVVRHRCDVTSPTVGCDAVQPVLDEHEYFPILVEQGGFDIRKLTKAELTWNPDRKPCLIFGSESFGIPVSLFELPCQVVSIPQRGVLRSLNVSAAAAMAMWHVASQLWDEP